MLTKAAFMWLKKQCILKYYYNLNCFLFQYILTFIPVYKAEFSASLLQSSVSHDHSEIISFLNIINVENSLFSLGKE